MEPTISMFTFDARVILSLTSVIIDLRNKVVHVFVFLHDFFFF